MAMAMPPRVIVLIVPPMPLITSTAAMRESGMAVSVMSVARTFIKNRNIMMTTRIPPSRRASSTFLTATCMKLAWRNKSRSMTMPSGRSAWSSFKTRSSSCVSVKVFALGCF